VPNHQQQRCGKKRLVISSPPEIQRASINGDHASAQERMPAGSAAAPSATLLQTLPSVCCEGLRCAALDGKVILSGNVHSWAERQEAERAAWAAPGVTKVEDRLMIVP
jgi:hypothetical protein